MIIRIVTIALALLGIGVGTYAVATADRQDPPPPPARTPPTSPYAAGVAAAGLVEAVSRNVRVSPPFAALVLEVLVEVNDLVEAGQPVVRLDSRELEAERATLRAALDVARAQVVRLEHEPRPEEVLVLEASDAATEAELEDARDAYGRLVNARDAGAASSSELDSATWKLRFAEALRRRAASSLALTKAGAWSYDVEIARARVAQAEAALASLEDRIERYTVRAPIAGTILKRSVEPGEFITADGNSAALVLGDISRLRVRAQIDEADLPYFVAGAPATARPRGRGDMAIDLSFVRLEPFAIVKTDLTGLALERVDTRIIEAVYDIVGTPQVPLVPGQLVDVYIDASKTAPSRE